ncbi:hypothetical protein CYMTET_16084 [Cymbomonas tetramitiformis]|uniref:Reverse transcriptase domain-containing protein n=1 Tax=Cymbomonas tetramitiformis TaxID=36881 RepID=A0AAE0GD23_9CHLO|nr:hypothetical protein CYMTET_16084 [Cymbomonas tetramitiformis]
MNNPSAFHECVEVEYLPTIKRIDKEWTRKIFDDAHADKEVRVKRTVVPKEQVALLVDNFNPKNFMNEKKIKCRTFVDLFAAGSEINLNLKPVLESRFGKADFKFISVDSDTKAKNVKGWVPMNIFRVQDNWKVLGQNVICAPPTSGMSDAAMMYFAEHCKDFCAFLVPDMWLADRAYPLRRMWWAKKQDEKLIYELEGVRGMRWIVCVKEKRKGQDLFAKTEEMYQKVAKAKFKTTLDATKAFHQIPMTTEADRDKTAFWWGNQLYRYTSMPFGAAGATAAFIRVMDYELRALTHCTVTYVDDIVVYSDTAEQHLKDVEAVLRTLGDAGIRLHSGKSTFGASTVDFLGYRIGHNTIGAQEAKCKAIQELPRPEDKTGLRSILVATARWYGLVGRPGGPNYSEMARPLNDMLKKEVTDIKSAWGKEQDESLQQLKDALCSGRCLRPIDYTKPLILYTDWSKHGIGAVLGQKDEDGTEYICVAIGRSLGKTERQYASFQGEMLAVV